MELHDAKKVIAKLTMSTGPGSGRQNLKNILNTLWSVADNNDTVSRDVFNAEFKRLRRHFEMLERRECIRIGYGSEPGRPIMHIRLLKRGLPPGTYRDEKPMIAQAPQSCAAEVQTAESLSRCFVFVDMMNTSEFTSGHDGTRKRYYFNWKRANWKVVREVAGTIAQTSCTDSYAYVRVPEHYEEDFAPVSKRLQEAGFSIRRRKNKDIDVFMVTDIALEVAPRLQKGADIKIVILSGDGDYAYVLLRLKMLAKERGANLTIHCLTWMKGVSSWMGKVSHVHSIETYLRRIDPVGYNNLMQDRQRQTVMT